MGITGELGVRDIMSVPEFPDFRPVELDDRDFLEQILEREQPVTSELTFANIFVWRKTYDFRVARINGGVAIRAIDRGGEPFFLPAIGTKDKASAAQDMLDLLNDETQDPRICRVPEDAARELESEGFRIELDRDNSDYVYLSKNLIELPGRKLHRKRNHIAQFRAEHEYEYRRVTPELVPECMDLQHTWCDIRDCFIPENRSLAEEHEAVMEALSLLDRLDLVAGAIIIEGRVAAFSVGGRLNGETLVVHFEKANPAYPGLYQVMNQAFAADVSADYPYINREQDVGEPGLRRAKESYYPHHMVHKYIVRPCG